MKKVLLVLLAVILVSCKKEGAPVSVNYAKDDFCVEFLFECDGTRIYRFFDKGRTRYFATGNGRMIDSTHLERMGRCSMPTDDTVIQ